MAVSREFAATNGTTNGAAWYPLRGGMQDWNYLAAGTFELTLELSEAKWPPPPALPRLFRDNLASLLAFPLLATAGARGVVTGAGGRAPPPPGAAVRVRGVRGGPPIRPHPVTGAFWRPLAPGTYMLAASAPGWGGAVANITVRGGEGGGGAATLALTAKGEAAAAATTPPHTASVGARSGGADGEPRPVTTAHPATPTPRRHPFPRRAGGPPQLLPAPALDGSGQRAAFVAQGAVAVASAGCLALMARSASRRAAAVAA